MMESHFNKLTPAETERLDCLAEECAEGIKELTDVIKQISKIKRHGFEDTWQGMLVDNRAKLEEELGDIRYWMIAMCERGDLSKEAIHKAADAKALRVGKWLHHNEASQKEQAETVDEPVTKIALQNTAHEKRISVLEDLLSSAYNIANRNGENTHWQRFAGQLHINGISPVTPKTFKILPSDTDTAQLTTTKPSTNRDAVVDAAKIVVENKQDSYRAKNGKQVFMEGDDGEKMYLVSFDDMFNLGCAINASLNEGK